MTRGIAGGPLAGVLAALAALAALAVLAGLVLRSPSDAGPPSAIDHGRLAELLVALSNASSESERREAGQTLLQQVARVREALPPPGGDGWSEGAETPGDLLARIAWNIERVDDLTGQLLGVARTKQERMDKAGELHSALTRSIAPLRTRWQITLDQARADLSRGDLEEDRRKILSRVVVKAIETLQPIERMEKAGATLFAEVNVVPNLREPVRLGVSAQRMENLVQELRRSLAEVDPRLGQMVTPIVADLDAVVSGPEGLIGLQQQTIERTAERARLIDQTRALAQRLAEAVDDTPETAGGPASGVSSGRGAALGWAALAGVLLAVLGGMWGWQRHALAGAPAPTAHDGAAEAASAPEACAPEACDTAEAPAGPRLLQRLPAHLGPEILALEMEDHYVRIHTRHGNERVLMRFRDALKEVATLEGLQVHRSYWVAARAVVRVVRLGPNKFILMLSNGLKVPVSRTYLDSVRDVGWLRGEPGASLGEGENVAPAPPGGVWP